MNTVTILNKIEEELNKALPNISNQTWFNNSFGVLSDNITNEHLNNLIQPNKNLITLGGKRWRPLLMILSYYNFLKKQILDEKQIYSLSPLVEFVHTASLIHDDIEDSADLRRGKPAAHISFGLDTALNSASWLYFEAPVCIDSLDVNSQTKLTLYQVYTKELRRLHLGQSMDIYWHRQQTFFPTKEEYFAMVKCKTGTLASLATKIGCIAGGLSIEESNEYGEFAANIGIGFQIIDDVINLTTGNVGKKRGDDIVEGKKSLPILLHLESHYKDKDLLSNCLEKASKEGINSPAVEECISILEKSNCIQKAAQEGKRMILENCNKFDSEEIRNLFIAMIPESFK